LSPVPRVRAPNIGRGSFIVEASSAGSDAGGPRHGHGTGADSGVLSDPASVSLATVRDHQHRDSPRACPLSRKLSLDPAHPLRGRSHCLERATIVITERSQTTGRAPEPQGRRRHGPRPEGRHSNRNARRFAVGPARGSDEGG
jgi:hypothetical protein